MAADGLGLVYNKQEGSGMAQIFGPSGVVDDLRKATLNQAAADKAARDEAAKTITPKAPKEQKLGTFDQPWAIDNAYISEALKIYTQDGTKKIAAKIDLNTDEEYQNGANLLASTIEGSNQQKILFNQQRTAVINDPKKFDVEATVAAMEEWALIPLMQRLSTPMPDPIYKPEEEKPFDFFATFKDLKIGTVTDVQWQPNRIDGKKTISPNKPGLKAQIDIITKGTPGLYGEGLKPQPDTGQPLWTNRDEMNQFYFDRYIEEAGITVEELIKAEPSDNVYGTGGSPEDVAINQDQWDIDFMNGNIDAAAFLTGPAGNGISTNDGYTYSGVSKVGTYDLNKPEQLNQAYLQIIKTLAKSDPSALASRGVDIVTIAKEYLIASPQQRIEIVKSLLSEDTDVVSVYRYNGVAPDKQDPQGDGTYKSVPISKDIMVIPQMMTKEERKAYHVKSIKNKTVLYGQDVATNDAGKIRNTGEPTKPSDPGTARTVGSTAPKPAPVTLSPSGKKIIPGVKIK
jgi:hypothetical protein